MHARGDEPADARRAREAEPATAGETGPHRDRADATAVAKRAHRGMGLGRGFVGVGGDFEVHVERERDRVERRTEIRRRRGNPHDPVVARTRRLGTSSHRVSLARNSAERAVPSCTCDVIVQDRDAARRRPRRSRSTPATSPSGSTLPPKARPAAGELCERHVRALTPPQGWHLEDRAGRRARAAEQLEATLDAHSPMLARAFQNAGAV